MVIFCHQNPNVFIQNWLPKEETSHGTFRVLWIFSKKSHGCHGSLGIKQWLLGTDEAFCTWCFSSQNVQNGEFYPADFTSVAEKGGRGVSSNTEFNTVSNNNNSREFDQNRHCCSKSESEAQFCCTSAARFVEMFWSLPMQFRENTLLIQARMNPIIMSCFTNDLPGGYSKLVSELYSNSICSCR